MTKEREIAEAIWKDLSDRRGFGLGSLKYDDPEVYEQIMAAHCEIIRGHMAATNSPAPQSESEAVRLLRELRDATIEAYPTLPAILPGGLPRMNDVFWKVRLFLQRPPGPDWRTLAEHAYNAWVSFGHDSTYAAMEAIRDALASEAAAAGKGAT